jgi:hypothetical protein
VFAHAPQPAVGWARVIEWLRLGSRSAAGFTFDGCEEGLHGVFRLSVVERVERVGAPAKMVRGPSRLCALAVADGLGYVFPLATKHDVNLWLHYGGSGSRERISWLYDQAS